MKLKFVNLTGATLKIRGGLGEMWPLPPDGTVAHVVTTSIEMAGGLGPFLLVETVYEIFGLPDPVEDTIFIVDPVVADRVLDRDDVVAPGEIIADDIGMPIGYNGLKTSGGGL